MAQDQPLHLIKRMNIDPALPADNIHRVKKNMRTLLNQLGTKPDYSRILNGSSFCFSCSDWSKLVVALIVVLR